MAELSVARWVAVEGTLASYAQRGSLTRGRRHPEPEHAYRGPYERDRDRIVHSTAFRRLEYKTQVFVNSEGDHYRTRLTHTFEVAQIGRTLARALGLNEALAEAAALAHDLGHPPFGHTGESIMNELLRSVGGFEHNIQGLRIVDHLENAYPDFPGLNLTYELRESFAKHHTTYDHPARMVELGFDPETRPSLEAQIVNLSDEIAYTAADLDDGLRAGLLDEKDLGGLRLWRDTAEALRRRVPRMSERIHCRQCIRFIIDALATDTICATEDRIRGAQARTVEDVRRHPAPLAGFSDGMGGMLREVGAYLLERFYNHPYVREKTSRAEVILRALFAHYMERPEQLPEDFRRRLEAEPGGLARAAGDYVAGMTDRFAEDRFREIA